MRKSVPAITALLVVAAISFSIATGSTIGLRTVVAASSELANPDLATRIGSARGVTIKVTPRNLGSDASNWEFVIQVDSHSQDLIDDFMKSSQLLDGVGGQFLPTAWNGTPSGGHHIEGVLRFMPISPRPQSIELQIRRIGDDTPRAFRWQLN